MNPASPRRHRSSDMPVQDGCIPQASEHSRKRHEHWIAMQAAYKEYQRISDFLDGSSQYPPPSDRQSASDLWIDEDRGLADLQRQQLSAFEHYVEARIAFLESEFEHGCRSSSQRDAPPPSDSGVSLPRSSPGTWPVSCIIACLFGVTLLSIAMIDLEREQKHRDYFEITRNELRLSLEQTGTQIQALGQKLDMAKATLWTASQGHERREGEIRQASGAPHMPQPQPDKRSLRTDGQSSADSRGTYGSQLPTSDISNQQVTFTLGPLRRVLRVGPLLVTLWTVDAKRKFLSLSITSDLGTLRMQHLALNEPVWITMRDQEKPIKFMIDRIGVGRAYGHFIESKHRKPPPNPVSPTE